MSDIPKFSPGCFGSAIAFRKDDMVCRGCKFASDCEVAHHESVRILRERYGLVTKLEPETERKITPQKVVNPGELILSKKTTDLIEKLDRGGFDIVGSLQRGVNPFGEKPGYLRILCHLLLRMKQPFGRDTLVLAFTKTLDWQQNTADAHARMAIRAFTHIGAIENNDGMIAIKGK